MKQRGGSRKNGYKKDNSLEHYLSSFKNNEILVFHRKFSPKGEGVVFALGTLFRFFDGKSIGHNVERIILVNKNFALHTLGVTVGLSHNRLQKSCLTLASYALTSHDVNFDQMCIDGPLQYLRRRRLKMIDFQRL